MNPEQKHPFFYHFLKSNSNILKKIVNMPNTHEAEQQRTGIWEKKQETYRLGKLSRAAGKGTAWHKHIEEHQHRAGDLQKKPPAAVKQSGGKESCLSTSYQSESGLSPPGL